MRSSRSPSLQVISKTCVACRCLCSQSWFAWWEMQTAPCSHLNALERTGERPYGHLNIGTNQSTRRHRRDRISRSTSSRMRINFGSADLIAFLAVYINPRAKKTTLRSIEGLCAQADAETVRRVIIRFEFPLQGGVIRLNRAVVQYARMDYT